MHLKRRSKGPFGIVDDLHDVQGRLAKFWGKPTAAMRTDLERNGVPVIFLHNPKTGGKSLRDFLNVKRGSHSYASERLSEKNWLSTYSIAAVREPFERYLSNYYDRILKKKQNVMVKRYGPDAFSIDPFQYLDVLRRDPIFGGPQTLWTDYPSAVKPRADLILRFEEIDRWKEQMIAAGLPVQDREFPHINRSARADSDHLATLGLNKAEFDRLEGLVREAFRSDYEAFGYA